MKPEKWEKAKEIFNSVLDSDEPQRAAYLDKACGNDEELRQEIETLLASYTKADSFFDSFAIPNAFKLAEEERNERLIGNRIGQYTLIKEIGQGGMGTVFLATRADEEFKKYVAIKLIKRGMDTADILRRFRNERQILASLNHPNIARLLDGGTTENGLPFFVMEYIEGQPLTDYCDSHKLSIIERLKLFQEICSAVQHAHQNLIVHRDLKPSNIVITPDGMPKLLDFGIAKFLNPTFSTQTFAPTATMVRLMTRDYASPEQVRGEPITTASDIYSLGVLLYKLLTGHHPYQFKTPLPQEIERVVCESIPEKPSTIVARTEIIDTADGTTITITPELVSQTRDEHPDKLKRALSGDLDNITLMAMRKEPQRRYASVAEFSEDIRRHLEGLPVIATQDTFAYRASKFIKRNKVAVTAVVFVALALLIGIIATTWQARAATRERDKARIEQAKAERIKTFLQDMLGAADPTHQEKDVKVIDVLKEAAERARTELAEQPEIQADILLTIGRTYSNLHQTTEAEKYLREALDVSLKTSGLKHPTTQASMARLAFELVNSSPIESEPLARNAIASGRELYPQGHVELAVALYALGLTLSNRGELKEAEQSLQEVLEMSRRLAEPNNGSVVGCLSALALVKASSGDIDQAKSFYRQAIDVGGKIPYRERLYLAQALLRFGLFLTETKEYTEAESILRESEKVYREQLGELNISIGFVASNLGYLHLSQGDYKRAEAEYRRSRDILAKFAPKENYDWLVATASLGVALLREGKLVEAEALLRESWEIRKKMSPGHWLTLNNESLIGECLSEQKKYLEAEPLLKESYERLKALLGDKHRKTIEALQRLVKLYQQTNQAELAAQYSAQLAEPSK
jgi:serine/threonine protein kinase/tetratricopeptide (TPR) repeat protein